MVRNIMLSSATLTDIAYELRKRANRYQAQLTDSSSSTSWSVKLFCYNYPHDLGEIANRLEAMDK